MSGRRAGDVDRWLAAKSKTLATSTLQMLHQCLNRAAKRAMPRDMVKRNVVELCSVPKGQPGRPSRSLTLDQAVAVLAAAEQLEENYGGILCTTFMWWTVCDGWAPSLSRRPRRCRAAPW